MVVPKTAIMAQNPLILTVETSSRIGSVALAFGEQICGEHTFSAPLRHSAEIFPAMCRLLEEIASEPQDIEHIYISIGPGSFTGLRIAATMAKLMHLANATKVVAVDSLDIIAANVADYIEQRCPRPGDPRRPFSCEAPGSSAPLQPSYHAELSEELPERIAAVLDAKRGQFFVAVYESRRDGNPTHDQNARHQPSGIEDRDTQYEIRDSRNRPWKKTLADSLMTAPEFLRQFAQGDSTVWLLGDGLLYHKDKFKADRIRFLDEQYWSPHATKLHMLGLRKAQAGKFADAMTLTPNYLLRPDIKVKTR
ncbi:MAG: tRNA (adenosine(37)-N6)-threonylcarbamoyltransferase complex dimerization subunit type 1 TsaB [Phycisphaerales bacterium]|nr:MAG: tRNA (adenosine(37)-N6)-threonylcarbamoyltransferase complex dimerization subunit type 1 TsaB [Phycisphaerales bacterium]